MANKPKDLDSYCAAYAFAVAHGAEAPSTIDPDEVDPLVSKCNTITVSNSLIKVARERNA